MTEKKDRFATPWLLKRHQMDRINWALPGADRPGGLRGMHNGTQAQRAFTKLVSIPFGQETPPHAVNADHMIFGVRGQVEFTIGGEIYRLDEHDLFFFPANAAYAFRNAGTCDAQFLSIVTEAQDGWPPESTYWEDWSEV